MSTEKLKVVFCWHMHQPSYFNGDTYQLPWTYLHGIKDYVDMIAHLEAVPQARVVVNFAPTLLEQIDDYQRNIQQFLQQNFSGVIDYSLLRDPLLMQLAQIPLFSDAPIDRLKQRQQLIEQCLKINRERLINRFPAYQRLVQIAEQAKTQEDLLGYLDEQFFIDLVMWYHLAWLGETVRRTHPLVQRLITKAVYFNQTDRLQLLEIIGVLLASIIPRYKALADSGQIELSFTPYAHPIIPLLLDPKCARESVPNAILPQNSEYPEGKQRARWHLSHGLEVFKKYFGFYPIGCWPSEGGVSTATVRLMEEFGVRWVATGETVLHNSLQKAGQNRHLHQSYHLQNGTVRCFFRDDRLSDLIGFEYSKWHGDDAVANLIYHLETLANSLHNKAERVVSIILDGENAWEYYPNNGYYFLSALYQKLAAHPQIEMSTFKQCLAQPALVLPELVAGSWVYGNFATWIGDKDKNRGWDMLIESKKLYDCCKKRMTFNQCELAEQQLALCEGSDWFWWFGDYNPAGSVKDFDALYRAHLRNLYRLLNKASPYYLYEAFTHGGGNTEAGGTMRRGQ